MIDGNLLLFGREGTLPGGVTAGDRPDAALRPLQHDGRPDADAGRARALHRTAARHVLRRPRGAPAARSGRAQAVAAWPDSRVTRSSRPPWTRPVSTTPQAASVPATIDLEDLGLEPAGICSSSVRSPRCEPGDRLKVTGRHPALGIHLAAWCRRARATVSSSEGELLGRRQGDARSADAGPARVRAGRRVASGAAGRRRLGARRARRARRSGRPAVRGDLDERDLVWADVAPRLYAQRCRQPVGPGHGGGLGRRWSPAAGRRSGRGPADDVSGRERAGGAARPGAVARPHPSAFPRSAASAGRSGRGRGAPHRGVHPACAAAAAAAGRLRRRRPGLAHDAAARSPTSRSPSFLLSVLGEGTFP